MGDGRAIPEARDLERRWAAVRGRMEAASEVLARRGSIASRLTGGGLRVYSVRYAEPGSGRQRAIYLGADGELVRPGPRPDRGVPGAGAADQGGRGGGPVRGRERRLPPPPARVAARQADTPRGVLSGARGSGHGAGSWSKEWAGTGRKLRPWTCPIGWRRTPRPVPEGVVKRIVTHSKPDADAIAAAWLAETFLFPGEEVEVLFVPRLRPGQAGPAADCLVDIACIHDPERLIFDHKPPAFADRNATCATRLVWEHLLSLGRPVGHLEALVRVVHEGDWSPPRQAVAGAGREPVRGVPLPPQAGTSAGRRRPPALSGDEGLAGPLRPRGTGEVPTREDAGAERRQLAASRRQASRHECRDRRSAGDDLRVHRQGGDEAVGPRPPVERRRPATKADPSDGRRRASVP